MTAALIKDPTPDLIWMESLPRLEIIHLETKKVSGQTRVEYLVRSASKLTDDDFQWLLDKGILVKGTMFIPWDVYDGSEQPFGRWTIDGKTWVTFYQYHCASVVD
jgi:hypothetical protein